MIASPVLTTILDQKGQTSNALSDSTQESGFERRGCRVLWPGGGEGDTGIPVTQMEQMKAAPQAASEAAEVQDLRRRAAWVDADYWASYQKEAAEDGWNQMKV